MYCTFIASFEPKQFAEWNDDQLKQILVNNMSFLRFMHVLQENNLIEFFLFHKYLWIKF